MKNNIFFSFLDLESFVGKMMSVSLRTRTANYMRVTDVTSLVFYKKICLKEIEVWRKVISNKIIVTLVTQGLPSSFLPRPVA